MKKIFFSLVLVSGFCSAQLIDEAPDDPETTENEAVSFRITPQNMDYFSVSDCAGNFVKPEFQGGEAAFKEEILKQIEDDISYTNYAPSGVFNVVFLVETNGAISRVTIGPKVANSEIFYQDLKAAAEKITQKWMPASCGANVVPAVVRLKINFLTDAVEF
jgi:hypothetical protein